MSSNLRWHGGHLSFEERCRLLRQSPLTIWFTGLSGAGKSTLAFALERRLVTDGRAAFVLDGDNIRHGLCSDLDFSSGARSENIRRVAEVARLFNEAGLFSICSLISPFFHDREMARNIIGADRYLEVYVATPLPECERRDVKGLYAKARAGELSNFTGVDMPYEIPLSPACQVDTSCMSVDACVDQIVANMAGRLS
ncbi:adenylyl-sulfate kinase [Ectopseudomonas oleovorans]|uniref:adenylyl-sulfate kinase n=1 Tax=Ectopseudomonas oleovorans TaxID=301 RepID=UPI0030B92A0F|nr:adenylylsulfate kinase [Pseudomonas oleovorans]MBN7132297.1 adenylylsulfate kinase [Pseudomonas oleovorans]MBN7140457.1 adenylylsulfate kinase [Pseudomonas oleovorans]